MPRKKQPTYEELRDRLNDIVNRLSDEKLTLDDMMKLYDEGNQIASQCQAMLDSYRDRIDTQGGDEKLARNDGQDDLSVLAEE